MTEAEKLLEKKLENVQVQSNNDLDNYQSKLASLRSKKQRALEMLLDDKIAQEDYDDLVAKLNPQIDSLTSKINELQSEEPSTTVNIAELKAYILQQLNPKQLLTELKPEILARFVNKIIVKADGQLEVHYRTSKPSAFYISNNIKLDLMKNHQFNN